MSQYILQYQGTLPVPAEHLESIRSTPGLKVLDESTNMMLVGGEVSALREKLKQLPGWSINPEMEYPMPDTRQKLV